VRSTASARSTITSCPGESVWDVDHEVWQRLRTCGGSGYLRSSITNLEEAVAAITTASSSPASIRANGHPSPHNLRGRRRLRLPDEGGGPGVLTASGAVGGVGWHSVNYQRVGQCSTLLTCRTVGALPRVYRRPRPVPGSSCSRRMGGAVPHPAIRSGGCRSRCCSRRSTTL
jgi:hypothetical protein